LEQYLGDPELDDSGVDLLRTIISESGALAEVEKMIQTLRSRALEALDHATIESAAHVALTDLAHAATTRSL
jgi:geranylgeranyl diphosphate synthase type I